MIAAEFARMAELKKSRVRSDSGTTGNVMLTVALGCDAELLNIELLPLGSNIKGCDDSAEFCVIDFCVT
jgi:hypothetical protein